jgi:hypothetical protein
MMAVNRAMAGRKLAGARPLETGSAARIGGTNPVKTHTLGTEVFAVFDRADKGGIWMLQFIWGKKDFRIYLSRRGSAPAALGAAVLHSAAAGEVEVGRLQYLYNFEWWDFVKVADHGLAREKVQFRRERQRRYVDLPKDFYDIAVDLACREFGLERKDREVKLAG